jgi:type III restriction enzyme
MPSTIQAKKIAAANWCKLATEHSRKHKGKAWKYLLVPHDMVFESTDLQSLDSLSCKTVNVPVSFT